ncbi:MAG: sigma-70 family RNA polymerase sigma factor [Chloroflexi bacterium]|nr:MAG: sigma-70 family RNA polymerase sigma factor [Chloroflexota bacterium]
MPETPNSEQLLIKKAQQGDLDAFNELVLAYQNRVYTVTYRIMGEPGGAADAAQDTFITAYRRIESYRGGNFRAWLLRIATNTCYDELRRQKRRPTTSLEDLGGEDMDDGPPLPDDAPTPEEVAQESELNQAVQNCISGLKDDQRIVLVMADVQGYSYQEIADTLNVQMGTVKSRLSRARLAVRRCLQAVQELLPLQYRLKSDD